MKSPAFFTILMEVLFGSFMAGVLITIVGAGLTVFGVWSPEDAMRRLRTVGKYTRKVWLAMAGLIALLFVVAILRAIFGQK